MKAPLFGATQTALSTSVAQYLAIRNTFGGGPVTTEAAKQTVVPGPMTVSNFFVSLASAPGIGTNYTFNLMKNGVATGVTVTVSDTNTSANDPTHSATFAAGDLIDIQSVPTGTPAAPARTYWNVLADSGDANAFSSLLGGNNALASTTLTQYSNISGMSNTYSTTESAQQIVVPTSGTISNLYVLLDGAAGAGASYQITLVKNGSTTALTATVSGASATTASDTSDSISVSAGDTISIQSVPSAGTAPTTRRIAWGLRWTPTNNGESFFGFGSSNAPSATATNYEQALNNGAGGWGATENTRFIMPGTCTLTAMYFSCGTAPGVGTSRTITVRKNSANSAVAATASGTNTTANVTAQSVFIGQSDTIDIQASVAGVPAADVGGVHLGILTYIAPPINTTVSLTSRIQAALTATRSTTARIQASVTKTATTVSRIAIAGTGTTPLTGRITANVTATRPLNSRIVKNLVLTAPVASRVQIAATLTAPANSRIRANVVKTVTTTGRIQKAGTSSVASVSRIQKLLALTAPTVARIVKAITLVAPVAARLQIIGSATRPVNARLKITGSATRPTVSRIIANVTKTISIGARIQVTGYGTPVGLLMAITQESVGYGQSSVVAQARIQVTGSSVRIMLARISISPNLTAPTISRIQSVLVFTAPLSASIKANASATAPTVARIMAQLVAAITTRGRIQTNQTATRPLHARIGRHSALTTTTTGRVRSSVHASIAVGARIFVPPIHRRNLNLQSVDKRVALQSEGRAIALQGGY